MNKTKIIVLAVAGLIATISSEAIYLMLNRGVAAQPQQQNSTASAVKSPSLFEYVQSNNTREALRLLDGGANPNTRQKNWDRDETVLDAACTRSNIAIVSKLLQKGADPNVLAMDGKAALFNAIYGRSEHKSSDGFKIVQMLVSHGASVNCKDKESISPLTLASVYGHDDTVKLLIDHGAEVNWTSKFDSGAISNAASGGNTKVIRLLLAAGADPDKTGTTYDALINWARECDQKDVVAVLEDAKAKRKAAGSGGLKK
ncbi:MAG: ankyrin repeat domain-containing protein [Chthonomonadales bacterium]